MQRSLEGVEGVREAKVSFAERKAWVTVEASVSDEDLEAAVAETGRFKGKVISRKTVGSRPVDGLQR